MRLGRRLGWGVQLFAPFRAASATEKLATIVDSIEFCTACHAEGRGFEPRRSRHFKSVSARAPSRRADDRRARRRVVVIGERSQAKRAPCGVQLDLRRGKPVADFQIVSYASILSFVVSGSARMTVAGDRAARALSDCVEIYAALPSMMITRSCSVRSGASLAS